MGLFVKHQVILYLNYHLTLLGILKLLIFLMGLHQIFLLPYQLFWFSSFVNLLYHQLSQLSLFFQYHRIKNECGFINKGKLLIRYQNKSGKLIEKILNKGDVFHFPPGAIHQEQAITDCEIIEASTPSPDVPLIIPKHVYFLLIIVFIITKYCIIVSLLLLNLWKALFWEKCKKGVF